MRHAGFVIGSRETMSDTEERKVVWRVRVKDRSSCHDGSSLIVASTHDGVSLAQGLNVNFIIGSMDNRNQKKEMRAVDVRIEDWSL